MYLLELMGVPLPATTALLSTSVSTTMPRSALLWFTARTPAIMASLSSCAEHHALLRRLDAARLICALWAASLVWAEC